MYTHIKEIIYQNRIKIETEIYKKVLVRFNIHLSRNELFLIKVLIDKLNIPHENTIACGDGFNDLSMIKYAAVGVAMENAVDAVKENADYITASNNDDGIAKVVEKFITD